jgi:hypothetical protein
MRLTALPCAALMLCAVTGDVAAATEVTAAVSPAPAGARFTPGLTWSDSLALPKLSGVRWSSTDEWDQQVVYVARMTLVPPLKPQYQALTDDFLRRSKDGKAEFLTGACWPNGVPRSIFYSYPPQFLFPPGDRLLITTFGETREVWMDGRPHPAKRPTDLATAYLGHSVGWWEGDTLVIDTTGFAPYHEIYYDVPNGGDMHVVERYTLTSPVILHLELTVYSSRLAKPWVVSRNYYGAASVPGVTEKILYSSNAPGRIETQTCRPGDGRENVDANGKGYVDLTPPPEGLGIGKK